PLIVREMADYRRWTDELLRERFVGQTADARSKLHAAVALLPVDDAPVGYLRDQLLLVTPAEFPIVRDALSKHAKEIAEPLWTTASYESATAGQRFQAACAVATFAPDDERWTALAGPAAQQLVGLPASEFVPWRDALRPVRQRLQQPLVAIFRTSPIDSQL